MSSTKDVGEKKKNHFKVTCLASLEGRPEIQERGDFCLPLDTARAELATCPSGPVSWAVLIVFSYSDHKCHVVLEAASST